MWDTHGHHQDGDTISTFFDFCRSFRPVERIGGGDHVDFPSLRKGADDYEKNLGTRDDVEAACSFLARFQPTVWLRGNHDERIWDELKKTHNADRRERAEDHIASLTKAAGAKCRVLPYDNIKGVFRYGDFAFIHGFHHGPNAARDAARVWGNVVMGHCHRTEWVPVPGRTGPAVGVIAGAGCRLDMDYARGHSSRLAQSNGFIYGVRVGQSLVVRQAKKMAGVWQIPTEGL